MCCLHFKHSIVGPDLSSNTSKLVLSALNVQKHEAKHNYPGFYRTIAMFFS